jgi:hypothetical protein
MNNKGLAAIPLILGLAFMVFSTAAAIKLSKQNQDLQNKAAPQISCLNIDQKGCFNTPCCAGLKCERDICISGNSDNNVPCDSFIQYYNQYCNTDSPATSQIVPCTEAKNIISSYCTQAQPLPTTSNRLTPVPSKYTVKPTTKPICSPGQQKNMGRFIIVCTNGRWTIQTILPTQTQKTR